MKTVKDIDLKNKTVLLRAGFDAPIADNKIEDNFRIIAGLPTLEYLRQNHCRIIVISHIGRQGDRENPALPVAPVVSELRGLCPGVVFTEAQDCVGPEAEKMAKKVVPGEILVLENLRFHPEEEKNDAGFSRALAGLADIFIQDAFCVLHRDHASVTGIPKYLPTAAGLLVASEVKELGEAEASPRHPAIVVLGGAKTETKIPVIANLLQKGYDQVLIGGMIANNFLKNRGADIKNSLLDQEYLDDSAAILEKFGPKIVLPRDFLWSDGKKILDIGAKTTDSYKNIIASAKTIIWNGPMGVFEEKGFERGTMEIGQAIAASRAKKIAGGGDTIAAMREFQLLSKMDFISTGGGVMLEFLSGKTLPGLEILK